MSTHIQWTDETWNPVAGCRKVSAGCDHCYAIREAHRMSGNPHPAIAASYAGLTRIQNGRLNWTGVFRELPERLDQPLRWKRPRRVFVNSLSDLFGEGISETFIARVFLTMAQARWHQFQILTKRPERMAAILGKPETREFVASFLPWRPPEWPLANVWLGTSVEDQRAAEARIPALLETPAAVRFLSCEPLLGPLDLDHPKSVLSEVWTGRKWLSQIDWVIAGGESGPDARGYPVGWIHALSIQCRLAGVPLFIKQLGSNWARERGARHPKGGDPEEWPLKLRIREWPENQR